MAYKAFLRYPEPGDTIEWEGERFIVVERPVDEISKPLLGDAWFVGPDGVTGFVRYGGYELIIDPEPKGNGASILRKLQIDKPQDIERVFTDPEQAARAKRDAIFRSMF